MQVVETFDVVIIGAGPSGAVAAAFLRQQGKKVLILEKQQFPRFSIGESLLPQSMVYLEKAGLLQAVVEAGFQHKNGAAFLWQGQTTAYDFREKFTEGWGTTYQVERSKFDQILADETQKQGAYIRYQEEVLAIQREDEAMFTQVRGENGIYWIKSDFILDASGFGRVLPRLLDLEIPSGFPIRHAIFGHIEDNIKSSKFDRNKILITIHPTHPDTWFWLIPFSNGRASFGVVAPEALLTAMPGSVEDKLKTLLSEEPDLQHLLGHAKFDTELNTLKGYSANVKSLYGPGYALLGNAGEFLDPIFSSGVTIALRSSYLAARCLDKQLQGEAVDWQTEYAEPLQRGVDTFRVFVNKWYDNTLPKVLFYPKQTPQIRRMIASVLAGYAWDTNNPYVKETKRRLGALEALCTGVA
jgi:flavin-dependent dehydrogenase